MALRWLAVALAGALVLVPAHRALAQAGGGGARGLDAPNPPGSPAPPAAAPATRPVQAPPPMRLDPHPRRGMAGIIVGWSGVGAAIASLAMMATCDPLFSRAREAIDTSDAPDVQDDVDEAAGEGTRICRAIYGAFGGAAGAIGLVGLPIGYGRRLHHQRSLRQPSARAPDWRLALRPRAWGGGGGVVLTGWFR